MSPTRAAESFPERCHRHTRDDDRCLGASLSCGFVVRLPSLSSLDGWEEGGVSELTSVLDALAAVDVDALPAAEQL